MQVSHTVCWGIDTHAAQLTACLRRVSDTGQLTTELHDCGTTYRELVAFRSSLQDQNCPVVALESTSVYWQPVEQVLSDTLAVCVTHSRDVRQRPGQKTDRGGLSPTHSGKGIATHGRGVPREHEGFRGNFKRHCAPAPQSTPSSLLKHPPGPPPKLDTN